VEAGDGRGSPPLSAANGARPSRNIRRFRNLRNYSRIWTLKGFKVIYAWEWTHRLLGRLVGLVFAGGFAWFWIKDRLPAGLKPKLFGILALRRACRASVGWWMVSSGLVGRVEVAQERLAIHLLLAAFIMSACLWVAGRPWAASPIAHSLQRAAAAFPSRKLTLALVFVPVLGLGGLVAGLRAGLIDNTWPLMEGGFSPSAETLWRLTPWWSNIVDNPITAQFLHRLTAYVLLALTLMHMLDAGDERDGQDRARLGDFVRSSHLAGGSRRRDARDESATTGWEHRIYCWRWGTRRSGWACLPSRPCRRAG